MLAAVVLDTVEVLVAVVVVVSVLGSVVPVLVLVLVIVVVVSVFVVVLLSIGAVVVAGAPVLVSAAPVPGLAVTVVGSPILVVLLEVDDVEEVGANDEPLGLDNGVADDGDARQQARQSRTMQIRECSINMEFVLRQLLSLASTPHARFRQSTLRARRREGIPRERLRCEHEGAWLAGATGLAT